MRRAAHQSTDQPARPGRLEAMVADGRVRPARRPLTEVLADVGLPRGPVTDAGTRALQQQRGERA